MKKFGIDELRTFCHSVFAKQGMAEEYYRTVTEGILEAHLRKTANQGLGRLPQYIKRMELGLLNRKPAMVVERETPAMAILDADNAMGHYAGTRAMQMAVQKAAQIGIGAVGVKNSSHFGVTAFYSRKAALENMIGIAFTNSTALMAPAGGADCIIGNNPISIAAPRRNLPPVLLDMACSNAAYSSIQQAMQQKQPVPLGWGRDKDGNETTDPAAILNGGTLTASGGYKGYGLAVMLDVIAGVLTGSGFTSGVTHLYNNLTDKQRTGHFMIALDVEKFIGTDMYFDRIEEFVRSIKESRKAPGFESISVPGDREDVWREEALKSGIELPDPVLEQLNSLASRAGVKELV